MSKYPLTRTNFWDELAPVARKADNVLLCLKCKTKHKVWLKNFKVIPSLQGICNVYHCEAWASYRAYKYRKG